MSIKHRLLVANRGEIALRVIRSAKELGIDTLSIHTEPDAGSPHVFQATETAFVPSYVNGEAVLKVALERGATLIHPGYGFLSENAEFASAVEKSGIIWLGPSADSIEAMGLKHQARRRAIAAQVPVLPGSELVSTVEAAVDQAQHVGYPARFLSALLRGKYSSRPVMLKATGGGGGMGMEVAHDENELRASFQRTVDMTKTLFNNAGVFVEKYIERARHIEVQVFGDGQGKVIHAGERECSVQRRHQKVLEEAGSPFINRHPELREAMCAAAVRLCELISYRSAGTVEFLVDDSTASFYFLEANTRLQVEHPTTEMVRPGLDLVAMMIKLGLAQASSTPFVLPEQETLAPASGHAIEARIYCEIPHLNFKPAPGLLQQVEWPSHPWLRLDTWVSSGSFVSPFYDPMIGKMIAWGSTREEARARLDQALSETVLLGTQTNLDYLRTIINCEGTRAPLFPNQTLDVDASPPAAFVEGNVMTTFLDSFEGYAPSCIEIIDGGLSTSVQDGRPRLQPGGDGIPRGGGLDEMAAMAANRLVGNDTETEYLEVTISGPTLKFSTAAVVAVTGAEADVFVDDMKKPMWSRFAVPAGSTLEIGACEGTGTRVYLAVKGGFPGVPYFMGSKSTFTAAKFGGIQGRDLAAGDIIMLHPSAAPTSDDVEFVLPSFAIPSYSHDWTLAALPGPNADIDYLLPEDLETLYSTRFTVSPDSNRLGLRLEGLKPLKYSRKDGGAGGSHPANCLEHGYSIGALNLNGDVPVLLAQDAPDCGGLICVVGVVTADWWKMGQMRPGDTFRFVEPTLDCLPEHAAQQTAWLKSIETAASASSSATLLPFPLDLQIGEKARTDGLLKIIEAEEQDDGARMTFRQPFLCSYRCNSANLSGTKSGDGGILIEVGEQALSFRTRIITELFERKLREMKLDGMETYVQAVSSLLLRFNPAILPQQKLVDILLTTSQGLARASTEVTLPSRRIHLPVAFDDSVSQDTIKRYMASSGRKKAVYLPSNIEYLAKASGLDGVDNLVRVFSRSDWFCTSRCFFAGLPMLAPVRLPTLDQRALLASQKYNPTRTFTRSGTLGFAGVQCAIYPVDSPGGYQILGRTLTPFSPHGKYSGEGNEKHFLVRSFDLVRWLPMSEEEFDKIERDFTVGTYTPLVEEVMLSAKEMAELERSTKAEVQQIQNQQRANLAELAKECVPVTHPPPWVLPLVFAHIAFGCRESVMVAEWQAEVEKAKAEETLATGGGHAGGKHVGTPLTSPVFAAVRAVHVKVGEVLSTDVVPVSVEAMKTEIAIKVSRRLAGKTVTGIAADVGDVVKPGQALLYCQ
ncbi:SPOSA6832_04453 [Sporobolomyces salmonicolor]|uniref:SPOSA6832_04453-mRNA-1:cds n=1 Tax=Sporidiobolus salmonicolor TaxID=5005 RepID=A0A0D6ES38_SPOSA|nr:SPOSA6832_04453 [Sporobolomyces salmonicolor]